MSSDFDITTRIAKHDVAVIAVEGYLDQGTCPELDAALDELFEDGYSCFLVDLSRVEYISSVGIGTIIEARRDARDAGGNLVLLAPSAPVTDVLRTIGALSLLCVVDHISDSYDYF